MLGFNVNNFTKKSISNIFINKLKAVYYKIIDIYRNFRFKIWKFTEKKSKIAKR